MVRKWSAHTFPGGREGSRKATLECWNGSHPPTKVSQKLRRAFLDLSRGRARDTRGTVKVGTMHLCRREFCHVSGAEKCAARFQHQGSWCYPIDGAMEGQTSGTARKRKLAKGFWGNDGKESCLHSHSGNGRGLGLPGDDTDDQ